MFLLTVFSILSSVFWLPLSLLHNLLLKSAKYRDTYIYPTANPVIFTMFSFLLFFLNRLHRKVINPRKVSFVTYTNIYENPLSRGFSRNKDQTNIKWFTVFIMVNINRQLVTSVDGIFQKGTVNAIVMMLCWGIGKSVTLEPKIPIHIDCQW